MTKQEKTQILIEAIPPKLRKQFIQEAEATGLKLESLMRAYIHGGHNYTPKRTRARLIALHAFYDDGAKPEKPFRFPLAWLNKPQRMRLAMRMVNEQMPADLKRLLM